MRFALALMAASLACQTPAAAEKKDAPAAPGAEKAAEKAAAKAAEKAAAPDAAGLVAALVQKHGEPARPRIERGVKQVLAYWRAEDGDPRDFVLEQFVADPAQADALLTRFSLATEQMNGHLLEIGRALRSWSELELGPQFPVDDLFAAFDVSAHVTEDLFTSKLAFVALLNFPLPDLEEMVQKGPSWTRREWAAARLTRGFALRPSGAALQERAKASAAAEAYIAGYNIWMHHVLSPEGKRLFPKGMRLLTHWNLRDQIKADYAEADQPAALARQRLIREVMERIVLQTIPQGVIDDPRVDWNPATNAVTAAPPEEIETEQMAKQGKRPERPLVSSDREPDTRYQVLLNDFNAARRVDQDSPMARTEIDRRFALEDEIPEARVRALFTQVLESPLIPRMAALIEKRLGRKLEPFDIWYDGFSSKQPEGELSKLTRARYPSSEAYKEDIPRLLQGLGFTAEKARWLDSHIVVDPARGSGHALEAGRRSEMYPWWGPGDSPHLRTRINPDGMDYKGYNIAIHEMGHNVEEVFSLYSVDDPLMQGVPGTAFSEALAFTFQHRDLDVLGVGKHDPQAAHLRALKALWDSWEIAGVALADLDAWKWMYAHPGASKAELREAVLAIARGYWDKYYAPVLGHPGNPQLGIYSHMLDAPIYLFRYPLGHLIAFQLEQKLEGPGSGVEFEKAATFGHVLPDLWMQHATGKPVVAEPMLQAAEAALNAIH